MNEIYENVLDILYNEFDINKDNININSNFYEMGLDQLDIADLFLEIESIFNIEFNEEEYDLINNIDKLVRLVFDKTKKDFE